jgi:branched-chain amino acid transport system ATP-binding protein
MMEAKTRIREPVLSARNLRAKFGGVVALDGVDLELHRAEICGVIGPNGAGKTTLFDCLTGVTNPAGGEVILNGLDITRSSATWRARHGLRRTFQRQQTFGWLTVEDNVLVALEWRGGGGGLAADFIGWPTRRRKEQDRRRQVAQALDLCGIAHLAKEPVANLPLGHARLVELARAIADAPEVLFLDEPTSGMEQTEASNLGQVAERLVREHGCSVVLVEHDIGFIMRYSHRVVALDLGRVIAEGTPKEISSNPTVQAAYLGLDASSD